MTCLHPLFLRGLLGSLLLVAGSAAAQTELLTNTDFAMDLSGWVIENDRPASWNPLDSADNPASGSALLSNVGVSNGAVPLTLTQCVRVNAGVEYGYGATVLVPTDQPEQTRAYVFIQSYASTDCLGEVLQFDDISSVAVDTWLAIGGSLFTSNAASSIRIGLGVRKPSGVSADAQAYFDQIYLQRTDGGGLINERLSGSWFNPETPGQGFFFDISPDLNLFFGGWFTWTDTPGEIDWMTVQGNYSGNVATVPIYRTTGGAFNDPTAVQTTTIGAAEFVFSSCTEAQVTIEFVGTGTTTVIPLERIGPAPSDC